MWCSVSRSKRNCVLDWTCRWVDQSAVMGHGWRSLSDTCTASRRLRLIVYRSLLTERRGWSASDVTSSRLTSTSEYRSVFGSAAQRDLLINGQSEARDGRTMKQTALCLSVCQSLAVYSLLAVPRASASRRPLIYITIYRPLFLHG